jgi:parallel beta-helix repeat protein
MPVKLRLRAAPATLVSVAVILALAGAGLVALSGAEAAPQPKCGDTITADTTLHKDLVDCPNNGILIGADDITLDLNGHLVDGDGAPAAGCDPETESCDVGVLNDGHDGVTVRDGSARQFDVGALIFSARHNRVLGISSSENFSFGFVVADSARSLVRNSSGSNNPAPEGDGIGLYGSHDIRVVDNEFRHNHQPGIHIAFGSADNLIEGNLISDSGPGILIEKADRNRVRRNRFVRNGAGLIVAPGSKNVIARNHFFKDGDGVAIEKGRGNVVARNVVVRARKTGIYLGLKNPPIGGSRNVARRNRVRRSGDDGFLVNKKDGHSLLRRNVAKRAGDDGFDVESRTTKLTDNRAVRNADLGIEAVRGVIDGGGNEASGNGDPRQCVNVTCH